MCGLSSAAREQNLRRRTCLIRRRADAVGDSPRRRHRQQKAVGEQFDRFDYQMLDRPPSSSSSTRCWVRVSRKEIGISFANQAAAPSE